MPHTLAAASAVAVQGGLTESNASSSSFTGTRPSETSTAAAVAALLSGPDRAASAAAATVTASLATGCAMLASYRQRRYSDAGPLHTAHITQQLISQSLGPLHSSAAAVAGARASAVGASSGGGNPGTLLASALGADTVQSSKSSQVLHAGLLPLEAAASRLICKSLSCILPVAAAGFDQEGVAMRIGTKETVCRPDPACLLK
jgi:hypothetical protein